MRTLYPELEPYTSHQWAVDSCHQIHVEECGNPRGLPVLFLHGGPGAGCKPYHRSFFNPEIYRIILLDQRGAGRSIAIKNHVQDNTTDFLLADLELIRKRLDIQRWIIFGGSWGSTLALLYSQRHPQHVIGLVLRGIFLARQADLDWFIKNGVNRIYPEQWQGLLQTLAEPDQTNLIATLHRKVFGNDELAQRRTARAWALWGAQVALGNDFDAGYLEHHIPPSVLHQAQLELHYAYHHYFIPDNHILQHCHAIRHIPTRIIHGRQDLMCPLESAYTLHQYLPQADLEILPTDGHIASTPGMIDALVRATDHMAGLLIHA